MRENKTENKAGVFCRTAGEDDAAFIAELESETFAPPWSSDMILASLRSKYDRIIIAELSGAPVGYIIYSILYEESELLRIAVKKECRRTGIARSLMCAMAEDCVSHGVEYSFLEVRASNAPATALYEKDGYERISVRKGYYSNPDEDAVVMRKKM